MGYLTEVKNNFTILGESMFDLKFDNSVDQFQVLQVILILLLAALIVRRVINNYEHFSKNAYKCHSQGMFRSVKATLSMLFLGHY